MGLYTAFIPMVIYALLGSSRVLSVSSTTTLAILAGTQLGLVVPDGDPAKLRHGHGHADRAGRRDADAGAAAAPGLRRQLHLHAGADRLQGRHRPGDRARPGAEAARHPHHQAGLLPRRARASCSTCPRPR
ncbi:MAG: SulP family inorganic anion transporter [Comamonadaceae bacterium]|nr:SulP family inorganic anion transporter [Comamonadaceae bacterium]